MLNYDCVVCEYMWLFVWDICVLGVWMVLVGVVELGYVSCWIVVVIDV